MQNWQDPLSFSAGAVLRNLSRLFARRRYERSIHLYDCYRYDARNYQKNELTMGIKILNTKGEVIRDENGLCGPACGHTDMSACDRSRVIEINMRTDLLNGNGEIMRYANGRCGPACECVAHGRGMTCDRVQPFKIEPGPDLGRIMDQLNERGEIVRYASGMCGPACECAEAPPGTISTCDRISIAMHRVAPESMCLLDACRKVLDLWRDNLVIPRTAYETAEVCEVMAALRNALSEEQKRQANELALTRW